MASKTFVNGSTLIDADWLNDVDGLVYDVFGGAGNDADARTNLDVYSKAEVDAIDTANSATDQAYTDTKSTTDRAYADGLVDDLSGVTDAATARTNLDVYSTSQVDTGFVSESGANGSAELPAGTTAQRDGTPAAGYLRFNTTDTQFEGYNGSAWGAIGGGGGSAIPARNCVINQDAVSQGTSTRTGFSTTIYTGNGSTQSIANGLDMSTGEFGGLVWIKNRDATDSHILTDTVRTAGEILSSNVNNNETTDADTLTTFSSTGFSVGADVKVNTNTEDYVAWSFQTTHKTTGTTNRNKAYTCHYNPYMGFSIVGYEGDGDDGHEIPHHLGRSPDLSIIKGLNNGTARNWRVKYKAWSGSNQQLYLDLNNALSTFAGDTWTSLADTMQLGPAQGANESAVDYISYNFASIPGVSKIGTYVGTGAAGNYVDCGFKPAFVLVKRLDATASWAIQDAMRPNRLFADTSAAEDIYDAIDFVEDGFVVTQSYTPTNALNGEYLFLAFAETSTDATKAWADYDYPTSADTLSIAEGSLFGFADGFDTNGQVDNLETVGAGVTATMGTGYEDNRYWLYKDYGGSYGFSEYRPLEGMTRNDADKWGEESPLDASLRTTARHFDYESPTGVALASSETVQPVWQAFGKADLLESKSSSNTWITAELTPWVQYKFNEPRILKSYRINSGFNNSTLSTSLARNPNSWTIKGSNDGFNWTTLDTVSGKTWSHYGEWSEVYDLSANTTPYLYHKIDISANNGDATYTAFGELELNTTTPSDYYLVGEGKMYNSSDTAIDRVYLAEIQTDDNGDVIWYENLPVAKIKGEDAELQGNLKVHGKISADMVPVAWGSVNGQVNPPIILDSYRVKDIVDKGTGTYTVIPEKPFYGNDYAVIAVSDQYNTLITESTKDSTKFEIRTYNNTPTLVDTYFYFVVYSTRGMKE